MPREKVLAFVPAHNEAKWIGDVVKPLLDAKQNAIVGEILVVDDGSTDNTQGVCEKLGVRVIRHSENLGKGHGFLEAVDVARKEGYGILFTTDADMKYLGQKAIFDLINGVRVAGYDMVRAPYLQSAADEVTACAPIHSGFRALRVAELKPFTGEKGRWVEAVKSGKFALETVLEEYFRPPSLFELHKHRIRDSERLRRGLRHIGLDVQGKLQVSLGDERLDSFNYVTTTGQKIGFDYDSQTRALKLSFQGREFTGEDLMGARWNFPMTQHLYVFKRADYERYQRRVGVVVVDDLSSRQRGAGSHSGQQILHGVMDYFREKDARAILANQLFRERSLRGADVAKPEMLPPDQIKDGTEHKREKRRNKLT